TLQACALRTRQLAIGATTERIGYGGAPVPQLARAGAASPQPRVAPLPPIGTAERLAIDLRVSERRAHRPACFRKPVLAVAALGCREVGLSQRGPRRGRGGRPDPSLADDRIRLLKQNDRFVDPAGSDETLAEEPRAVRDREVIRNEPRELDRASQVLLRGSEVAGPGVGGPERGPAPDLHLDAAALEAGLRDLMTERERLVEVAMKGQQAAHLGRGLCPSDVARRAVRLDRHA